MTEETDNPPTAIPWPITDVVAKIVVSYAAIPPATTPVPIIPGIAISAKPATPIPNAETPAIGNTQSLNTFIVSFDATFAFIVKWTAPVSR